MCRPDLHGAQPKLREGMTVEEAMAERCRVMPDVQLISLYEVFIRTNDVLARIVQLEILRRMAAR